MDQATYDALSARQQAGTLDARQQDLYNQLDQAGRFDAFKQPAQPAPTPQATTTTTGAAPTTTLPESAQGRPTTVYDADLPYGGTIQPQVAPDFPTAWANRMWPPLPQSPAGAPQEGWSGLLARGTQDEPIGYQLTQMGSLPFAAGGAAAERAFQSPFAGDVVEYGVPALLGMRRGAGAGMRGIGRVGSGVVRMLERLIGP